MAKLTQEQWDALSEEDKALRHDEKPDDAQEKPQQSQTNVEELSKQVKDLTGKLDTLTKERDGIIGDLREERSVRQQLDTTVKQLQQQLSTRQDDPLAGKDDEDFVSVREVKQIIANAQKTAKESTEQDRKVDDQRRSQETYANDEARMQDKKDLEVPYKEAIEEFGKMAKAKPSLWRTVHLESLTPGGKPAELAYQIALTSPTFINRIKTKTRDALVTKLENEGKLPKKLPAGGSPSEPLNPANMTEEQMLNLSDEQLDKILRGTG